MISVYHNGKNVITIVDAKGEVLNTDRINKNNIASVLFALAKEHPNEVVLWCNQRWKEYFDVLVAKKLFHHNKLMLSYNPFHTFFLDESIGYVDTSLFVNINHKVTFPTWQMSSEIGVVSASVLIELEKAIPLDADFDYYLCSLAKLAMPQGLLCYSEPNLLKQYDKSISVKASAFKLFRFVKQHYKLQWVFLLFFNLIVYERRFPVFPFLFSFFYKYRGNRKIDLDVVEVKSFKKVVDKGTVDVIIPTIGRKSYLYDVLKDFSKQTLLPNKIIIVEQNPKLGSKSELDYLTNEKWPFDIKHIFIHQAGACNARNFALDQTENEWVFLADDDNRFEADLLSDIFKKINQYGNLVVTTSYPQVNESKRYKKVIQWSTFGAGNSFIRKDLLENVRFNKKFEFGYGEDGDFGMQLRNKGFDVLYLPKPEILHLKAPIGGFRTKPVLQWQNDEIQPKPSPTIMLYQILHNSLPQINNYKTTLFFKYYRLQKIKNPFKYYINFQKQWSKSVFWANELKDKK